jgi:predicted adenine nucleotide alpha hydrolase (AANH) superfamily ATPase
MVIIIPKVELIWLRMLVHICCAPCFTYIHQYLTQEGHDITGYFYNPNIHPYQEYLKRLHCLQRYTSLKPADVIFDKKYDLDKYLVGALQARYDPPADLVVAQASSAKKGSNGSFHDKIDVRESLQIRVHSKDDPETKTNTIHVEENSHIKQDIGLNKSNPDFNPRCGYCIGLRLERTAARAAAQGYDAFTTTLLQSKYQQHDMVRALGERLAKKHGIKFYYKDFRQYWKDSVKISKELELYRQQYCGCIFSEYERYGPD